MIKEGINKQKMIFREGSAFFGGTRTEMAWCFSASKKRLWSHTELLYVVCWVVIGLVSVFLFLVRGASVFCTPKSVTVASKNRHYSSNYYHH